MSDMDGAATSDLLPERAIWDHRSDGSALGWQAAETTGPMTVLAALSDVVGVDEMPLTVARLRELLADDRAMVSLTGERGDETYVLEHRGAGWLVFVLERGLKRDFRKHGSEDTACRDLLTRLGR